jgi:F-type H+-transporting ATPase subunit b
LTNNDIDAARHEGSLPMILLATTEAYWQNPTFWVGVATALLVVLAIRAKLPGMVTKSLDDRAAEIKQQLADARRLREEAAKLLADYQKKRLEAEGEAKAIIDQAQREAEAMAADTRASLKDTLERRTKIAEDKIARAEAQAVTEVRAAAIDAAVSAAEKIMASGHSGAEATKLVDVSIQDLKRKLN